MKKQLTSLIALLLVIGIITSAGGFCPLRSSADSLTEKVLIPLPVFRSATGVDLNLRLNPEFVETAKVTKIVGGSGLVFDSYQNGVKLKAGIISSSSFSNDGSMAVEVSVTLRKPIPKDTELCKLLQMSVNERIIWQATDCILLSGVADGGIYNTDRTVYFNEGTATLNGEIFTSGSSVTTDGEYTLIVTDNNGKKRTASFTLDKTAPVITVSSFDTTPSDQPLTVTATANEGTLNQASYTFRENGNFTFVATDAAGNRTEKTVTVSHLYQTYTPTILNKPANVTVLEGLSLDVTGWKLKIDYDNGMTDTFDLTADMVSYDTSVPGAATGTVTCGKFTTTFEFTVQQKSLTQIRITKNPTKTVYLEGEAFDKSGMEVTVYYDNNTSAVISDYTVSGYDSTPGTKSVTVSYGGKSATLTVTVEAKSLVRIEITEKPAKLTYLEGEPFNPDGMVLTAYYNNGTSASVNSYTISGYTSTVGTKTVTVSYGGKSDTVTVTVKSRTPSAITSSVYYVKNETIRKISKGTTVATLLAGINERDYCKVYQDNSVISGSTVVGTGMTVKIMDGTIVKASYTVIVTGDINGDGGISVTDMISVKSHLLKKTTLSGVYATAADTNGDGSISITDFIQIKAHILGKGDVVAR